MNPPPDSISRAALLEDLGYRHPQAATAAVDVLVRNGLVNARRERMAATKREACCDVLERELIRLCDGCAAAGRQGRERVPVVERVYCERCGGSPNRAAVARAAEVFRREGMHRLVVVGGSPGVHLALRDLWPLELRIVDGTERHVERAARTNLGWADVVVVWASSELNHKVSEHYTSTRGQERRKVIIVPRRGVEALADALASRRRNQGG